MADEEWAILIDVSQPSDFDPEAMASYLGDNIHYWYRTGSEPLRVQMTLLATGHTAEEAQVNGVTMIHSLLGDPWQITLVSGYTQTRAEYRQGRFN